MRVKADLPRAGLATHFRPKDIYVATLVGALNQIDNGTTTLVDWCHNNPTPAHTDAAIAALRSSGIRAMFMHGTPKPDPKTGEPPYWETPHPREEILRLRAALAPDADMISLGLAILGPHYATLDVTLRDFRLAEEFGLIASMHQGGGPPRNPDGWRRLEAEGLLNRFVNIVHGNDLSDEQLRRFVARDVRFTITPESELISGHGHPILGRLRDLGVWPSIGSDIETAHSSDMLTAARIALSHQRSLDNLDARRSGQSALCTTKPTSGWTGPPEKMCTLSATSPPFWPSASKRLASERSPIGLLMTMPTAPVRPCWTINMTVRSKRGSLIEGAATSNWPVNEGRAGASSGLGDEGRGGYRAARRDRGARADGGMRRPATRD